MRAVNADDLIQELDKDGIKEYGYVSVFGIPIIEDCVPVVRCSKCKYTSFSMHQGELHISCENTEGLFRDVPEDGYCYCGEEVDE